MNNIKLNSSDYSRIDEIEKLVNSLNGLVLDYNKSTKNKEHDLKSLNNQIEKKSKSIDNANKVTLDLSKKLEELEEIKVSSKKRIKDLEEEKASISFSNSDIQKMETQEITELINSKNAKIEKLTNLINNTKTSISNNNKELNELKNELTALESAKIAAEKSLKRTDALIELLNETSKNYINSVKSILSKDYFEKLEKEKIDEEPKEEEKEIPLKEIESKPLEKLFDEKKEEPKEKQENSLTIPEVESPKEQILPLDKETNKEEAKLPNIPEPVQEVKPETTKSDNEFSILDSWEKDLQKMSVEEPKEEEKPKEVEPTEEELSNTSIINEIINEKDMEEKPSTPDKEEIKPSDPQEYNAIKEVFSKESINFDEFDEETKKQLKDNIELVKKNLEILKNHKVPLDLTIKQPRIYYGIKDNDLNDLLSIITTDEGGNGMGFDISYVYYCLDELSKTDVDKLIDVYNKEFMNITSKSGIISLLKKTNPELGDFKATIEQNKKILKDYGINNPDEVERECKEFIEIDNPLFMDLLNVFDKEDLVQKINSDAKIAEQILEYWKNN